MRIREARIMDMTKSFKVYPSDDLVGGGGGGFKRYLFGYECAN